MASNEHSGLDNAQLHVPKDFSLASNSTVLTKNSSGSLEWQDDKLRTTHFVRVGGFMSQSVANEYAPTYSSGTTHVFDTVVTNPTTADAQETVAQSILYCTRDGFINAFDGVVAITNGKQVKIRLYKLTPVDEDETGLTLTQLGDTVQEAGEGNNAPNVFNMTSLTSSSSFSAGDVLLVTLEPHSASATVVRFNSTIEVVYTS